MTMTELGGTFGLAAVQAPSAFWDRAASTDRALTHIARAARRGVDLVCFGEAWLPGYPFFSHLLPSPLALEAAQAYLANAVTIPGPETEALCGAARQHGVDVAIGIGELEAATGGSVYCTLLLIGREGVILGRHRKLKPTYLERLVWADGDAQGLRVHERPWARLSGLNCWEHQMMLPGYALAAQGTEVHVATWPGWDPEFAPGGTDLGPEFWPRLVLLSRAFASQAAAYVVAASGMWRASDVPSRYRPLITRERTGDSCIIGPSGQVLAGPLHGQPGILVARGSRAVLRAARTQLDIAGHYARPDLFRFDWVGRPASPGQVPGAAAPEAGTADGDRANRP